VKYTKSEAENGTAEHPHDAPETSVEITNEGHTDGGDTTPIQLHGFYSVGTFTVGDKDIYAFKNNGELQHLKKGTTTVRTMKGFRWYIQDVTGDAAIKSLSYTIDEEGIGDATAIDFVEQEQPLDLTTARIYDLQGRSVQNGTLTKGIYIVNGKKIFVK
jgi:hypothetical protein